MTVTVKAPTVPEPTVNVEEAVPPGLRLTLAGFNEAVRVLGVAVAESAIAPVKPPKLLRSMDEVPAVPACIVRVTGLDEMAKSLTPTVNIRVRDSGLLVPVIVTV